MLLLGYLDGNCQTDTSEDNTYFYYDSVTVCTNIENIKNVAARISLYKNQIEMLKEIAIEEPNNSLLYENIHALEKALKAEKWRRRSSIVIGVLSGYIIGRVHEKLI